MTVPFIHPTGLPEEERAEAWNLTGILGELDAYVRRFESAIALYDHASQVSAALYEQKNQEQDPEKRHQMMRNMSHPIEWHSIAIRDGGMSVYHFYRLLKALGGRLGICKSLLPHFDKEAMREAVRLFENRFPSIIDTRDAISHAGDMHDTPKKARGHAFDGPFESKSVKIEGSAENIKNVTVNVYEDNKMTHTWEGGTATFELSPENLQVLRNVQTLAYKAYEPVKEAAIRMFIEQTDKAAQKSRTV